MISIFERDIVKLTIEQGIKFMTEILPILIREMSYMKNLLAFVLNKRFR